MVSDYFKALKQGETGAIIKLVVLLVLVWFLYNYFTGKDVEGMKASGMSTFDPYYTATGNDDDLR